MCCRETNEVRARQKETNDEECKEDKYRPPANIQGILHMQAYPPVSILIPYVAQAQAQAQVQVQVQE